MLQCLLCEDEFSETKIEIHLAKVHCVDGPKQQMYISPMKSFKVVDENLIQNESRVRKYWILKILIFKIISLTIFY